MIICIVQYYKGYILYSSLLRLLQMGLHKFWAVNYRVHAAIDVLWVYLPAIDVLWAVSSCHLVLWVYGVFLPWMYWERLFLPEMYYGFSSCYGCILSASLLAMDVLSAFLPPVDNYSDVGNVFCLVLFGRWGGFDLYSANWTFYTTCKNLVNVPGTRHNC